MEYHGDPLQLRISDADRHKVAELLRDAAGEGRLDLEELDERLEATYRAKVYADLVPLVSDLPGAVLPVVPHDQQAVSFAKSPVPRPVGAMVPATRYDVSVAVLTGQHRKGCWEIGPQHTAFTLMGGVDLDLREAHFAQPEAVITAVAVMGGIDIIVNEWTRVVVEGVGIMGDFSELRPKVPADLRPTSPTVRVKGAAIMGAVNVRRKRMPGEGPAEKWRRALGG